VYLHCLPQALMERWLHHMAQQQTGSGHLDIDVPGTPEDQITTIIDTTHLLAQRELAMAAHASQTSPYEGLPTDLRAAFLTTDQLHRIIPAWTGGDRETDIFTTRRGAPLSRSLTTHAQPQRPPRRSERS